ncbi:MAG: DUF805 domain-containing protein [Flavobacterium sp.]
MKNYLKVLKQFADFSGRASREEYWTYLFFATLFSLLAMMLDHILGIVIQGIGYGPLYALCVLFSFIPAIAVGVRRLHDIGKSGWMLLVFFVPLVGPIWLLVLFCSEAKHGYNTWGYNPKRMAA